MAGSLIHERYILSLFKTKSHKGQSQKGFIICAGGFGGEAVGQSTEQSQWFGAVKVSTTMLA